MKKHKWHALNCLDCGTTIALSPEPLNCYQPIYCYLCAVSHAYVATWMMPNGNGLSANSLFGIQKSGKTDKLRAQFESVWVKQYAKLDAHRSAKVKTKLHANKISLDQS